MKNKNKPSNLINEYNVKLFNILLGSCVDFFLKRIGLNLLNKHNAVVEKVADHEELVQCTRGDSVIYVRSSKDFEIA